MANTFAIHIDGLRTVSPNVQNTEHWRKRNARKKEQQREVYFAWKATAFGRRLPKLPVVVRLTRFGPRLLDSDNLAASFKGIRDTVAELMHVDDGSDAIQFEYGQQHDAGYAVTIQVEAV